MYTISEIAHIIGGELHGNSNSTISRLQTDSRAITFPEETLFFAIKTGRNDGHEYIEDAYRNQVRNFVIETDFQRFSHLSEANFICIDNSVEALQRLTIHHRNKFDIPVIGITGSNGKTIVKEWIYQLLQNEYKITRSPRSYNSLRHFHWCNFSSQAHLFPRAGMSSLSYMRKFPLFSALFHHIANAFMGMFPYVIRLVFVILNFVRIIDSISGQIL